MFRSKCCNIGQMVIHVVCLERSATFCKEHLTRSNYFAGPGPRDLEETSVSRSIIYQAGETANLPCDISFPNNQQKDELMLIMWYREDVRSPIYSIGKLRLRHYHYFVQSEMSHFD